MATSNNEKEFCSNYMVLNPEDVKLFDLFHILFSRDIEKRKFVDCPERTEESFERRWIIFVSIVVQKVLQYVKKPLASFGSFVEVWLHRISNNRYFGKVDKSSATFLSLIANLDQRVELDGSIKPGSDAKYYAMLSAMAAKIAYENKAYIQTTVKEHWKMDFLGSFDFWNDDQEKYTTQAFLLHDKTVDPNVVVVAFRGTEPFDADAWCTDFDLSWYEIPGVGKLHGGFMKALGLQKTRGWPKEIDQDKNRPALAYYGIREKLRELMRANDKTKFIVTGHSLGGALAILFPAILALHEEEKMLKRMEGIYTYGQPRVGDEKFGEFMKEQLKKYDIHYYRVVYGNDMVPRIPYDDSILMFKHFGNCIYFNSLYKAKVSSSLEHGSSVACSMMLYTQVLEEEPNKNYFSIIWVIPKILNAFWELIRSFVIPFTKGLDYKEGWLLKMFRVLGLVVPGVVAHIPQNYVNVTRLGSSDVYNYNSQTMTTIS